MAREFEDETDPDRSRATEFGVRFAIREGRRRMGFEYSWFFEDRSQALILIERKDGRLTAALEDFD